MANKKSAQLESPGSHASIFPTLAKPERRRYSLAVAVNPAAGRRNPNQTKAHQRPKTIAGAFFTPEMLFYGGHVWAGFGLAGFLCLRFPTPRMADLAQQLWTRV